jgi:hypothetical protein
LLTRADDLARRARLAPGTPKNRSADPAETTR